MRRGGILRTLAWLVTAGVVCFAAWVSCYVWIPDSLFNREPRIVATTVSDDGTRFTLTQHWGFDFYTTRFLWVRADGTQDDRVLDGDDHKIWWARIELDEPASKARVLQNGALRAEFDWGRNDLRVVR